MENPPSPSFPAASLRGLVEAIEAPVMASVAELSKLGRQGSLEAEGELRRGLIAMNGAGLLAVVSMLNQSLSHSALRIAAAGFFLGMLAGFVSWLRRVQSFRVGSALEVVIGNLLSTWRSRPDSDREMKTSEEIDGLGQAVVAAMLKVLSAAKKPGSAAYRWTYAALLCFFISSAILLVDFELRSPARIVHAVPARVALRS